MAIEKGINPFSWPASGTLATKQYYCVSFASDGEVQLVSTLGAIVLGVLQNDPAAVGRGAEVQTLIGSVTKVQASATGSTFGIAIGGAIQSSTLGKAEGAPLASTGYIIGRSIEALTSGAEKIISMMITHEGHTST